jgi:DNA mismatch repair protein MutL
MPLTSGANGWLAVIFCGGFESKHSGQPPLVVQWSGGVSLMPIRILSERVASQIAAGEVIERPASVVKELVENALDASATTITIEVRDGGRRLIRVADDGHGIASDEVSLAFHRHSTSKLSTAEDLDAIQTLGFRGEALASIASVAQVTMVTRAAGELAGSQLRVEGGQLVSQEAVGAPQGTMVGVENLFYNVPARRKFLRTDATEKRHIDLLVTRYAMAYPAVRFRLTQDGRSVFQSPGTGSLADVLIEVFGLNDAKQMLALVEPPVDSPIIVRGFTSAPSLTRGNRGQITLFVNGRWIQDTGLTMVEAPSDQVDVNVHPTKAEIRFRDQGVVFSAVQRAVRQTLVAAEPIRPAEVGRGGSDAGWTVVTPREALASLQPAHHVQAGLELPGGTAGQHTELPRSEGDDCREGAGLPLLRAVGQIGGAFIVAEGPAGMVVIDQHAAHERVLYEQMVAQRAEGIPTQALLDAVPVDLTPDRVTLLEEHLDLLSDLGFVVEPFGGSTLLVRGLPALLGQVNPTAALEGVADDLERGDQPLESTLEERVIARVCKTAAIKAGQVLTLREMSELIRQLEACKAPHTCPHGRPTMIQMSAEQLARQFERT